ncbi:MAG: hypothetical protein AAFN94_11805 [Pseudomonadota bacterium]
MTALSKYDRLETTGLWRASSAGQRREVVVSIGDATLVISDLNDSALTHWSLAAVERAADAAGSAVFYPDGDPGETLELPPESAEMIEAIETLRAAVARARPHPGRLRWLGAAISVASVVAIGFFWLPGALVEHALRVVPPVKEAQIGTALLARIERVSGPPCMTPEARPALAALAGRTGAARVHVLPGGVREALALPGDAVLINRALVEDHEAPEAAAGYVLAELERVRETPALRALLEHAGTAATIRLLTTGALPPAALDAFAESALSNPPDALPPEALIDAFARARVHAQAYGRARDISGEETLELIEADPLAGQDANPIMADGAWLQLQAICES